MVKYQCKQATGFGFVPFILLKGFQVGTNKLAFLIKGLIT